MLRSLTLFFSLVIAAAFTQAQTPAEWRSSTAAEQALDAEAFKGIAQVITDSLTDVQSAVVMLRGRRVYEYYRDGSPDRLRDTQSVSKSALSLLTGIAIGQGKITSVDQPVVALVPEWAGVNADPRAASMTVRHLLTMSAGFEVNDANGTAAPLRPRDAWARALAAPPGEKFAYDNSLVPLLGFVIERAVGMPLADYARQSLVVPLGMAEPGYQRGFFLRTVDMARLGQLALQKGQWGGRQLVPEDFMLAATKPQNQGGAPVGMPYGYMWWTLRSETARPTFMANGFGGQFIWVHPPLELVIAINSTVALESNRRGHALQLLRNNLFNAAKRRDGARLP